VKIDLLKMISELKFDKNELLNAEMEQLCCIMASLMHQEVISVRVPDFVVSWRLVPGLKLLQLVETIGTECPKLTSLNLTTSYYKTPVLTQTSDLAATIFKVLPRLVNLRNLQINYFICGDRALQQIGLHCTNLV
jgi:hypothetical protein